MESIFMSGSFSVRSKLQVDKKNDAYCLHIQSPQGNKGIGDGCHVSHSSRREPKMTIYVCIKGIRSFIYRNAEISVKCRYRASRLRSHISEAYGEVSFRWAQMTGSKHNFAT